MMKYFFLLALIAPGVEAYTLNNNFGGSFKDNEIKVFVDSGTTCSTNLLTVNELESLVDPAVNKFWNKIPTSSLKLDPAGFSQHITTINQGRLCSPTDDECISEANTAGGIDPLKGLIPPVNEIVIACNRNPLNFGGGNVLAVTIPNKFSSKKISGAVILINDSSNNFGSLSRSDQIGVLSHEIGHALGLGHSEDEEALMYYRTVNQRSNLGQDDIDGINYLYPMLLDTFGLTNGLLGSCGTISTDKNEPPSNPPFAQMGITLGLMILIGEVLRLFYRTKTRSAS